ncbi:RHM1 [Symbiodinium natans]|uniref:RHM1 protein n=1 Tax=Symbiodinium natans TaxID=878477 RepID=A0A812RLR7_9DINO|nr:RHM1 [Symbiodinium natans]CAE7444602.1 RHM1 [Symbiodinium natans]
MTSWIFSFACLAVATAREAPVIGDSWTSPEELTGFSEHYMGRQLAQLNSILFQGTAGTADGGGAEQWIVAFCPSWWEPCHHLELLISEQAAEWQKKLNTGHFTAAVRFAIVDCATEKVLCNTEQVKMYPTIAQYKDDVCSQGAGRIGVEFLGSS